MARSVQYDRLGGPEVLDIVEHPSPSPGEGGVVVRVRAVGLNPFDAKARTGFIPMDLPFPRRAGGELTGSVVSVGDSAVYSDGTAVAVGDEVVGWGAGTLATEVEVPAAQLAKRPASVLVEIAAGITSAGLTALASLRAGEIGTDDTVLVGGASGAVGLLYSQLAIRRGAKIVGTANPKNQEFLRTLGVIPVPYGPSLSERAAAAIAPGRFTSVLDCHGREALEAGVELGVPKDRIYGIAGYGAIDELGVRAVPRYERHAEELAGLLDDLANERLTLPVAGTFPLDDVQSAFRTLEGSHPPGKIVVTVE